MSRVFISYSRKDETFARRLATDLDRLGADIWIDVDDIPSGMDWSNAIQEGLDTCEVMLLVLSPDSMASRNVQSEWTYFMDQGKPLVPIWLRPTKVHFQLHRLQYVDFHTQDYDAALWALCYELRGKQIRVRMPEPPAEPLAPAEAPPEAVVVPPAPPPEDVFALVAEYYRAFNAGEWEAARRALDGVRACEHVPPTFDVEAADQNLRAAVAPLEAERAEKRRQQEAERARLQRQQEVEQAYAILKLRVQHEPPAPVWAALLALWEAYPNYGDYDPDGIAEQVRPAPVKITDLLPPPFEWVAIPAGRVELEDGHGWFDVPAFAIAKYPVTNAQYAEFMTAGGYEQERWWTAAGWQQRQKDGWTQPRYWGDERFNGAEQPVVGVSWYEAIAFCHWRSEVSGEPVTLPTEQQWQRAAQGDDGRIYPWGDEEPDERRCNFGENVGQTTPVTRYPAGASPYGVMDMAGNVWEWCRTAYETGSVDLDGTDVRVLRGGSWYLNYTDDFRAASRDRYSPPSGDSSRGFRCARSR